MMKLLKNLRIRKKEKFIIKIKKNFMNKIMTVKK